MTPPAVRWPVPLTVAPYVLLVLLAAATVAIERASSLTDLILCALLTAWMPGLRRIPPAVFVTVLITLTAVLVIRAPWFGFFTPIGYVCAFRLLHWPWQPLGVAAVAWVAGTAQAYGVDKTTTIGLLTYAAVVAANIIPMCAYAWFARRVAQQDQERERALHEAREANRKLAASLAENAALQDQLLAQARNAGVQDERQRMAREIHDTLAQGLTGIISQLRAAESAGDEPPGWGRHGLRSYDGDAPYDSDAPSGARPGGGRGPFRPPADDSRAPSGLCPDDSRVLSGPRGHDGRVTDQTVSVRAGLSDPVDQPAGSEPGGSELGGPELGGWRRHVAAATALAAESLAEARRSVHALRPEPLRSARLGEALAGVAERWAALHQVSVQVTTTGTVRPLQPEAEAALLRVAQEALANVARHARASRVGVTLSYLDHEVALDVRDDGNGFDAASYADGSLPGCTTHDTVVHTGGSLHSGGSPALHPGGSPTPHPGGSPALHPGSPALHPGESPAPHHGSSSGDGGFGLIAMRQRIERLSGTLQVESEPGTGTGISARVPAERTETYP